MTEEADKVVNEIWQGDLLDRRLDAKHIIYFLKSRVAERRQKSIESGYVLNIDAGWGRGKTFFLKKLAAQLEQEGHLVAYVNSWEDDHADDPLLAVVSAIDGVVSKKYSTKTKLAKAWAIARKAAAPLAVATSKHALLQFGKKIVGESGVNEASALVADASEKGIEGFLDAQAKQLLERFEKSKSAIEKFRSSMSTITASLDESSLFFVLIDELDRCRPTYAIALLERVKHLFNSNGIVFIVATDTKQLCHSIKAVYGAGFDSAGYLNRFFDRAYSFPTPDLMKYARSLFAEHDELRSSLRTPPRMSVESTFVKTVEMFGLGFRDAEQCFDLLRSVATLWSNQIGSNEVKLDLLFLLTIICLHHSNRAQFDKFAEGNSDVLKDVDLRIDFNIEFEVVGGDRSRRMNRVPALQLVLEIAASRDGGLENVRRLMDGNEYDEKRGWLYELFDQEIRHIHQGGWSPRKPPTSILRHYPDLVRTAGRLTKNSIKEP